MKYYPLVLLAICAFAQQRTTYTLDVNGKAVRGVTTAELKAPGATAKRQTAHNVNGRSVPLEEVEERVISDDGRIRITEQVIRGFGPNGERLPAEKTRIEEIKNADGSVSATASTWRGDVNGNLQLIERSASEIRKAGDTTTTTTVVERPSLNGSLELAEKREQLSRKPSGGTESDTVTVFQKDANGRLEQAARTTVERTAENGRSVENVAMYELGQLVTQMVTRSSKSGNGEQVEQDVFVTDSAGRAKSSDDNRLQLRERRLIERTYNSGGSVDKLSVQTPLPSDPGRLSAPRFVEETVCTGACRPEPGNPQP